MKKLVLPTLVVALLLTVVSATPAPKGNAQAGLISSIFNRMQRNQQSLKTLRADISMEKYNSSLRESVQYYGQVRYIPVGGRSAFVRLEWNKPQHEILVVANGGYILWRPSLNMAYVGSTNSIHSQKDSDVLALMNMSPTQLRTRFTEPQDVHDETLWGGVWTQHFKVTPNSGASYKYIEVWVDKDGMPVQTKMVEKNDDATTVRLTNVAKNQTIPMDQFTLKLDSSVKKVRG